MIIYVAERNDNKSGRWRPATIWEGIQFRQHMERLEIRIVKSSGESARMRKMDCEV